MSPRLDSHDSINRINKLIFYCNKRGNSNEKYSTIIQSFQKVMIQSIESINQNYIVLTGENQTEEMLPHFSRVFIISGI